MASCYNPCPFLCVLGGLTPSWGKCANGVYNDVENDVENDVRNDVRNDVGNQRNINLLHPNLSRQPPSNSRVTHANNKKEKKDNKEKNNSPIPPHGENVRVSYLMNLKRITSVAIRCPTFKQSE
ncbi:MAG: hypothetical protein LUH22_03015 [Bacteroides sp.]|nr:hypothetical protein [Bacteroides sp.]